MNGNGTLMTDAMWRRLGCLPSGKATDPGVTAKDNGHPAGSMKWRFPTLPPPASIGQAQSYASICRRNVFHCQ